jgi:uncharacterized protein YbjQ (UPF0145 family)
MNKKIVPIIAMSALVLAPVALARNTIHHFSVADVLGKAENSSRLQGVSFYFGDQTHAEIKKNHGEDRTNKKTNAFNKSDLEACQIAMMSALLQLHKRAQSLGANAVVNIKSNYQNNVVSSETEYVCGAGGLMAGVALIGTFVGLQVAGE